MTFVYTVFFVEWEACKDFLRDIRFPSRSQIEIHVFHRKDADQNQLRNTIPDKKLYDDRRPIVIKHSSLTAFPKAVEDILVYYASSYDFSRFKKPDVYLVSGEGRRYEELAKILRKARGCRLGSSTEKEQHFWTGLMPTMSVKYVNLSLILLTKEFNIMRNIT
ncbi:hypothetical protein ABFA07_022858 [Porites harrisoni]